MKKEDLNDVVERLEALDSLAQLFKKLWFGKIKDEIKDEKVKAYLMVFEDAFPGLDHVVSFVSKNAKNLSESQVYQVKEEFENLSRSLLNREIAMDLQLEDDIDPGIFDEESHEEETDDGIGAGNKSEESTVVNQKTVDDLFTESDEDSSDLDDLDDLLSDGGDGDESDIDELLYPETDGDEDGETTDISEEEMAAFLEDDTPPEKKK